MWCVYTVNIKSGCFKCLKILRMSKKCLLIWKKPLIKLLKFLIILKLKSYFSAFKIYLSIYGYATVTTSQGALIIGGSYGSDVSTVACYNNAGWSRLDNLQSTRYYHRAIINGDKVYVVGGAYIK